ncbi:helix-turn-helix domain-containing protein [Streptococcus uberis]|uniref:helix-turn-helix domain-containing protein n=1 Tax=Streptococcus uberis TaxID=1349 RepID=UPI003F5D53E6
MNRLKELRKEKGLTQSDLGKIFGVSKMTVLRWENGENQIKPDKAKQLADYFNVTIAYLLGHSDFEKSSSLKDLLFHEIKGLKEYRMLRVGNENYISENDVLNVVSRYVNR